MFLVRDVPAWMSHEDISADIESKYSGLKLAQAPGWLVPRERREGHPNATILLALLGEVEIEQFGNRRLWIGNQSCKVDIYYEFAEYTQCPRCMGFGHPKQKCKPEHTSDPLLTDSNPYNDGYKSVTDR
jgi:hypothetical protein